MRLALALLALHAALLLALPPIPPIHNGFSVPSYVLGNGAALLAAWAALRGGAAWVEARRGMIESAGWRGAAAALVVVAVGGALALRAVAPGVYFVLSREEGLFEPLSLLAYAGAAGLVWAAAGRWAVDVGGMGAGGAGAEGSGDAGAAGGERKRWRLVAAVFLLLALEEVDYFGIFGGVIGRIGGEYAGALHDVIRLSALGLIGAVAYAVMALAAAALAWALWRAGYLAPGWLLALARRPEALWALAGAALLLVAAAEETHLFGWVAAQPTPEEAVEMGGGFCLALWAVESVARLARRRLPDPAAQRYS